MLEGLLKNKRWLALAVLCIVLLAMVRAYEDALFYDPFLNYFKRNFTALPIPETDNWKLFLNYLFRYGLNATLSLAVIYALFRDAEQLRFAAFLYVVFFILMVAGFFLVLYYSENRMTLFYIRRFIIQPLLLLLFIPGFYFQERASGKK
jgi:exosortase F-associated protein